MLFESAATDGSSRCAITYTATGKQNSQHTEPPPDPLTLFGTCVVAEGGLCWKSPDSHHSDESKRARWAVRRVGTGACEFVERTV